MAMVYFTKGRIQDIAAVLSAHIEKSPRSFKKFLEDSNSQLLESEMPINMFEVMSFLATVKRTGKLPDKAMQTESTRSEKP